MNRRKNIMQQRHMVSDIRPHNCLSKAAQHGEDHHIFSETAGDVSQATTAGPRSSL